MKDKLNSVIDYILLAVLFSYVGLVIFDIVLEKSKEIWMYKEFLKQEKPLAQWQTNFIKETLKMTQKGINSRITELSGLGLGLLGGVRLGNKKKEKSKTEKIN